MEDNTSTQRGRLNALAVYLDMSVRKLAQFCNLSTATVYHITDNSSFVMSERTASRICYQDSYRIKRAVIYTQPQAFILLLHK